jgi:hypothetical protein
MWSHPTGTSSRLQAMAGGAGEPFDSGSKAEVPDTDALAFRLRLPSEIGRYREKPDKVKPVAAVT